MTDTRAAELGTTLLRIALGVLFIAHGLTKLLVFTLPGTAEFFASVGFPGWTAYPVTALEVAGGVALVLGVLTRPVALALAGVALGAASVHLGNGWMFSNKDGGWEFPVFLAVACLVQALLGSGALALRPGARST